MKINGFVTWMRSHRERFVLLAVCLLSVILVTYPVFDFDLYWHLANGREMVDTARIVSEEVFSYTHPGEKFANHEWLGQIIFYLVWNAFGAWGLFGFKLLLVTLMVWLLYRTLRNESSQPGIAALLCVLVVLAGINRYHERPELFSLFNTALLGFILYGFRARRLPRRLLWAIPAILIVWDWLHGAVYGLTFLILFVAGENAKHRFAMLRHQQLLAIPDLKYLNRCFALTLLAMLVNPFGLRSYGIFVGYVVGEADFNQVITEFTPVTWDEFKVFILLFAATVILALRNWRRFDFTYFLLMTVFGLAALRFNRVTGVAAIVLAPVLSSLIRVAMQQAVNWAGRGLRVGLLGIAAVLAGWYGYQMKFGHEEAETDSDKYHYLKLYDLSFGYGMDESFYPVGAVNFIREQKLKGHLYNSGNLGGYLSYCITPERKIFQYNMGRVFGDPFYYVRHPDELEKWDIGYAILDTESEMALFPSEEWAVVYRDEADVLVVRRTAQNEDLIRQHEPHYFSPALSEASLLERAEDPAVLSALAEEIGDNLAYREDKRIAAVWAEMLGEHAELLGRPHIRELLARALRYNHVAGLADLADLAEHG